MNDPRPTDYAALLKRSLVAIDQLEAKVAAAERARSEPIAIIGIGCRFPGEVDTPAGFWRLLHNSVDAVTEVPRHRWDIEQYFDPDPDAVGKTYTRWGAFVREVDRFDAAFFGISPREAVGMDPQQRLLLELAWEALEHAGIAPASLAGSQTAVYVGLSTHDYSSQLAEGIGVRHGDAYTPTGTALSVAAGRISYVLGLHGPNVAIDTACSSSLVALHWAAQSLRLGEADLALAGGVNLMLTVDGMVLTSRARMMSFDGRCKTFDASADGYVRGEGGGMLVLKRLSDARRDGDRVLALLRGSALNQDGRSSGLTVPNGRAQEAVIRAALANARLEPGDIDYVEAHGTGTPLGDPIEVKALHQVYGVRPADSPLLIGSVKTNIGHLEAAAGVASVVKCVLAMQEHCIPANLHLREPNPLIPWDEYRIVVPTAPVEWPARPGAPRRAAVSSFGFSGTNAHVILEEALEEQPVPDAPAPRLLVLSAQTSPALTELAGRYVELLAGPSAPEWAHVVATAALGRSHLETRLALVASGAADAQAQLAAFAAGEVVPGIALGRVVGGTAPEIVFMFTGQGAQRPGMTRQLFETQPVFRQALEECARLLEPLLPRPLLEVMFSGDDATAALLDDTAWTQPALFAVEYALAELWRAWGVEPTAVMGHSVGEYVAACVAGVFSLEDGLRLIAERGRLMSALPRGGGMAAVFADEARVRAALAGVPGPLTIAGVNGPQNTVVSGGHEAIAALLQRLAAQGIEAQPLRVSHAFHSPLMDPILDRFEAVAATVRFSPPRLGLVSNVSGRLAGAELCTPAYWRTHVREAVRFGDSITTLQQDGYRVFVEVGPASTLIGMAQPAAGEVHWIASLRKGRDDTVAMLEALGQLHVLGQPVRWTGVLGPEAVRRRVTLPSYPFQRERYWHTLERADAVTALAPLRHCHPLLGGRVESALAIFQGEIGPGLQPWLADHRIFDFTLFPASGFLELALAAAREALGDHAVMLRDVSIREGLRLPDEGTVSVQVIATPAADDGLAVQVFSRVPGGDADSAPAWRLHASATAVRAAAEPAPRDLAVMQREATGRLEVPAYYERLAARGANYGAIFRGISSLARSAHGVLGQVRVGDADPAEAAALLLHPALLDACFQLVGAGLEGDICVPVGLAEFRVHRIGAAAAWCEVVIEPADPLAEAFRADLTLVDDAGAVIAEVRGLDLRRTSRAALQRVLGAGTVPDWAYEVDWPVRPLPEAVASVSGRWLLFADAGGVADALGGQLKARGHGVVSVRPGCAYRADGSVFEIDLGDPTQFVRLLADAAQCDARPLQGIVFLWPLDEFGGEDNSDADFAALGDAQRRLLTSSLHLAQALAAEVGARLWFVTRGAQAVAGSLPDLAQAPVWGFAGVVAAELAELRATRIDLDPDVPATGDDAARPLLESLLRADAEDRIAWRGGKRHVARLIPSPLAPTSETPRLLEIRERGTLENLVLRTVRRARPGPGEVEIRVHATGLNFRDVLNALGMYPGDPGPLGNECSGVITAVGEGVTDLQVGDDVLAMVDRSFATWVVAPAALVVRKPASLTHVEAATIPVTFLTAQYALRDLARIEKGNRVLIHAVTGGVGMAALQLARQAGAVVFGTAGSPAKRALALALGAHHVADSRSLTFEADVMRATGGEGVDIVLNSLAGDFIPASLRLLRRGGHFIEIGKTGIWDAARVAQEFPGIDYHQLYLGEIAAARPLFVRDMLKDLLADVDAGRLTPLPQRCYPIERAEDAFRFMGQGQHTGKIVLTQRPPPTVRADASYLITGGLGGLGLACARGLADAGARHILLLGRRPPSPAADAAIAELRAIGATVAVAQADVADAAQLAEVIARIEPPLRGVLHAAGRVDDAMLAELTPERFDEVMAPKVRGTMNLHRLTARCPLDFFVMFSSGAALFGSPGQGNYAAANSFMDALAHRRRGRGAPALSINWGSWSEVGMAAAVDERHRRRWAAMGLGMIAPDDGVRMLLALLAANRTAQAAALPLVRSRLPANLPPFYAELLAARRPSRGAAHGQAADAPGVDLLASLARAEIGDRSRQLSAFVAEQVVKVLALGATYQVDPHRSLMDLGMDSLMAMELRNRIQTALKVRIDVADLLKGPSIHTLSAELLATVSEPAAPGAPAPVAESWEEGTL